MQPSLPVVYPYEKNILIYDCLSQMFSHLVLCHSRVSDCLNVHRLTFSPWKTVNTSNSTCPKVNWIYFLQTGFPLPRLSGRRAALSVHSLKPKTWSFHWSLLLFYPRLPSTGPGELALLPAKSTFSLLSCGPATPPWFKPDCLYSVLLRQPPVSIPVSYWVPQFPFISPFFSACSSVEAPP